MELVSSVSNMFLGRVEASHLFVQVLIGGADMGLVPATASVSRASRAQPGRRAPSLYILRWSNWIAKFGQHANQKHCIGKAYTITASLKDEYCS